MDWFLLYPSKFKISNIQSQMEVICIDSQPVFLARQEVDKTLFSKTYFFRSAVQSLLTSVLMT